MNKEYNVDDILLEIKAKKKQGAAGVTAPAGFPVTKKAEPTPKTEPVKSFEPVKGNPLTGFNFNTAVTAESKADTKIEEPVAEKKIIFPTEEVKTQPKAETPSSPTGEGFSFKKTVSVPKEELPVKRKETFKVTIPEEESKNDVDYNKYFTNLKDENEADSFRFKSPAAPAFTPEVDPMEATREVSFSGGTQPAVQPVKPVQKAPFKLNFNFDDEDNSPAESAASAPTKKSLFPDEMLDEEEPKKGLFRRKKAEKEETPSTNYRSDLYENEDDSDLDDYSGAGDKESVIRDMKMIKTGLIIRFLLMLAVFGVSAYLALSATNPLLTLPTIIQPETQLRNFMIANTAVAAIGALICSNTVGGGLLAMLKLKADCDTLPSMATIAVLAQGVCFIVRPDLLNMTMTVGDEYAAGYAITNAVSLFFPVAMLILLFNLIGKIMTVLRIQNNFKMVASDRSKYSINMMENKGLLKEWTKNLDMEEYLVAYPVKTRFLSKFLEYSYSEDYAETMSAILAPVSILAGILISVLSYFFNENVGMAISTFAAVMCVCTPLSSTIAANWPMLRLSNKLTPNGAMVAGYESISKFADTEGVVVRASDIFPPENVTLHAIKAFDQSKIDSVIVDAASVVCSTKGMLTGVFNKIIGSDKTLLQPVENITYEDGMGLSAWVNGKRVLIGNRELMIHHGVEVPSMDYEKRYVRDSKNIIYLSNSGELSAMFVISYNPNNAVMDELDKLADNGMFLIVETSDPNITAEKIHEAYDFPLEQLQIMPAKTNSQYRSMTEEQASAPARIGYIGGAKTMIRAICDCMTVKSSIAKGVVIQMASLIIGYGIIAVFSLVGDLGMLNFVHLIIYQLFWTLLVLIIPNLRKL
ncbi:MAG: hypothetical protein IJ411_05630 [Oscillospiraceae bacterium]|nr:hypothetical protein [Oscillospiraceae bacterium]